MHPVYADQQDPLITLAVWAGVGKSVWDSNYRQGKSYDCYFEVI
jgi:hypothetical protein